MDKRPVISIIVPVYNVLSYLDRCVTSILQQTFENFELLLVDDGSTDGSGERCDELKEQDSRITVFHKSNGGLSDARNYGIDRASGEYLTFIDSDDFVAPEFLEVLYGLVREFHTEMSVLGSKRVFYEEMTFLPQTETRREVLSFREAFQRMCLWKGFGVSAWSKLYHKDLFAEIRYPVGKLYEDMATTPWLMEKCTSVAVSDLQYYYYYQRQDSIMNRRVTERDYVLLDSFRTFVDHFGSRYPELRDYAVYRAVRDTEITLVDRMLFQEDYREQISVYRERFRGILQEGVHCRRLSRLRRLQAWLILHSPGLHRIVFRAVAIARQKKHRKNT